jgi:hypothetical protein
MRVDERQGPRDETLDDRVDSPPAEAEDDEDEVEAHGGWGGVGRPGS